MKAFIPFFMIMVIGLAGCAATLHDVQQSPPMLTISSDLSAKTVANKIAYKTAQESLTSRMFPDWNPAQVIELENGNFKILVTFTSRGNILLMPYPPLAVAEMTIIPADRGGSLIEYRGVQWTSQDKFLAMVKQCASPQNNPGK
jgi:hypothetical protein